jgi:hypothetical protein
MKTLVVIGLCFFSFGTFAQTGAKTEPAKTEKPAKKSEKPAKKVVAFKTITIERNDIPYDSKDPFVFEFKNNGKKPLLITNVQTSCGCTAAQKPTAPIAKGKSDKIVVTYDTKRVGNFTKTITVTTNIPEEPTIVLTIKGTVKAMETAPATNEKTQ